MKSEINQIMLSQKTFKCKRCGECCMKYIIKLNKPDIERIKKLGYKESGFSEFDKNLKAPIIKKGFDYWCMFLDKDKKGIFFCKIYETRPSVCKKYPFVNKGVKSCKPVTFSKER